MIVCRTIAKGAVLEEGLIEMKFIVCIIIISFIVLCGCDSHVGIDTGPAPEAPQAEAGAPPIPEPEPLNNETDTAEEGLPYSFPENPVVFDFADLPENEFPRRMALKSGKPQKCRSWKRTLRARHMPTNRQARLIPAKGILSMSWIIAMLFAMKAGTCRNGYRHPGNHVLKSVLSDIFLMKAKCWPRSRFGGGILTYSEIGAKREEFVLEPKEDKKNNGMEIQSKPVYPSAISALASLIHGGTDVLAVNTVQ